MLTPHLFNFLLFLFIISFLFALQKVNKTLQLLSLTQLEGFHLYNEIFYNCPLLLFNAVLDYDLHFLCLMLFLFDDIIKYLSYVIKYELEGLRDIVIVQFCLINCNFDFLQIIIVSCNLKLFLFLIKLSFEAENLFNLLKNMWFLPYIVALAE